MDSGSNSDSDGAAEEFTGLQQQARPALRDREIDHARTDHGRKLSNLGHIEEVMNSCAKKKTSIEYGYTGDELHHVYPVEIKPSEDYDDEFYDVEKVAPSQ